MKKTSTQILAAAICVAACATASAQTTTYNQDVGAFVDGTGNSTGGFTQTTQGDLTIDVRANNRTDGTVNDNGANVYTYAAGFAPGTSKATWSYAFQISTTEANLGSYTFFIVANGMTENIGTYYPDNSFGTKTGNANPVKTGTTTSASQYAAFAGANNVIANAENITFPPLSGDATAPGVYTFEVYAEAAGSNVKLADTTITVDVVPEVSSTVVLFGAALLGLGAFAARSRRQLAN